MGEAESEVVDAGTHNNHRPKLAMWRWRISLGFGIVFLAVIASVWFARERLAGNLIEDELEAMGLGADYTIERIGATRQVVSNLVIGDPESPDFTAEQVSLILRYRLGLPTIGRVEMVRPRLYGTLRDGKLSFGALDPVIFTDSDEPARLPDLDTKIVDGRALLDTEFGPIGIKLEGEGELDSGFAGVLAASAPKLEGADCKGDNVSLFGEVTTRAGRPTFDGPIRLSALSCSEKSLSLRDATIDATLTGDADLAGGEAEMRLAGGASTLPGLSASGANGTLDAVYRKSRLTGRYTLALRGAASNEMRAAVLTADGAIRASEGFARVEIQSDVEGNGLRLGNGLTGALAEFGQSAGDTLLAPLLRRARGALEREARGSSFAGSVTYRTSSSGTSLVVPTATLRGGSGATLFSASRVQIGENAQGAPRFLGNFQTGGEGLPRIVGRMERRGQGNPLIRLQMAPYSADGASIAIPELVVAQTSDGRFGFSGNVTASGALPGGAAQNLKLPIDGNWSRTSGLAMWRRCTAVAFDRLELANLVLEQRELTLCPSSAGSILRSGSNGLNIAAGAPSLDLSGMLGDTPITIASGPIGFAWPGAMSARDLDVTLGQPDSEIQFNVADIKADLGEDIRGTFDEADVRLYAVPLDIRQAGGSWSYADGIFAISDGSFTLEDREEEDRFEPLVSWGATLSLKDNLIAASADLREPESDRIVTSVDVEHDLDTGSGFADLDVDGIRFDDRLQPEDISQLALGVIANAEGVVSGAGRVDWSEEAVTSLGAFSTEALDFAAAFGPVKGASGTIVFDDLINMTTAPGQTLKVASINPGIEISDGEIAFDLKDGTALSVASGTWPFLGGTLTLQPIDINFGASEVRRYVLEIQGLDAAQFIERMELGNLSATGTFDGTVPLVFDELGNGRIEGGLLISRPPGGNLSYVGELTYEDLSAIANFAFDTLRSLDYREMTVGMDGSLTGEIVTKVRFDGVKQGEGTKSNILTRQIAKLPVRFNVNIRAPFYQLITSFKAMYDPAFVRDPRELGLLSDDGTRLRRSISGEEALPDIDPEDIVPDEPPIQTPESENM